MGSNLDDEHQLGLLGVDNTNTGYPIKLEFYVFKVMGFFGKSYVSCNVLDIRILKFILSLSEI